MPANQCCNDCMQAGGVPMDGQIVPLDNQELVSPRRAPAKATLKSMKKSPQAMYPYSKKMRR